MNRTPAMKLITLMLGILDYDFIGAYVPVRDLEYIKYQLEGAYKVFERELELYEDED